MTKKKLAILITSVALIAAVGIGGTLAYFTDKDTKQNVITLGKVDGSLIEDSDDGTSTENGFTYDKVKPGDELDKRPHVSLAADSEDAYVRMDVKVTITGLAEGTDAAAYAAELKNNLDIDKTNWTEGSDGYFYYNTKLSNKEGGKKATEDIFSTVTIPTTWGNEISEAVITIDLQAELIQADNFENQINADGTWNITADDIKEYTNK